MTSPQGEVGSKLTAEIDDVKWWLEPLDLIEPVGAIEAHGPFICRADAEMRAARAIALHLIEPGVEHLFAVAAALKARQKVDMKMGRIRLADPLGRAGRMMDEIRHALVRGPLFMGLVRRVAVGAAQSRPPLLLELLLECMRVEGANDVTAYAFVVFEHECAFRREGDIGAGINMADNFPIPVEMRRVLSVRARFQADPVDGFAIPAPVVAYFRHWPLHAPDKGG